MAKPKVENLYILKQKATDHMGNKKFTWATVYLTDCLKQLQDIIQQVDDADQMEKLIRQIKLPCHKNLALCYMKQSNYIGCIKQCEQVLQIQPNCVKILFRMGSAYMNMSPPNFQLAEKYLRNAFLIDPNQKQVMRALEQIEYKKKQKLGQTQKKSSPNKDNSYSFVNLIKLLFFWPFILMSFMYRKFVPEKFKLF